MLSELTSLSYLNRLDDILDQEDGLELGQDVVQPVHNDDLLAGVLCV